VESSWKEVREKQGVNNLQVTSLPNAFHANFAYLIVLHDKLWQIQKCIIAKQLNGTDTTNIQKCIIAKQLNGTDTTNIQKCNIAKQLNGTDTTNIQKCMQS
jgi:hypothetical protein